MRTTRTSVLTSLRIVAVSNSALFLSLGFTLITYLDPLIFAFKTHARYVLLQRSYL